MRFVYGGPIGVQVNGVIRRSFTQRTVALAYVNEQNLPTVVVDMTLQQQQELIIKDLAQPSTWFDPIDRDEHLQNSLARIRKAIDEGYH